MPPIRRVAQKNRGKMLEITYDKKTTGETVKRTIRPYEFKGKYLYATDTLHGAGQIHAFIRDRIKDVKTTERKFKPKWDIQF